MLLDAIANDTDRVDVERFDASFTTAVRAIRDAGPMRVDRGCVVVAPRAAAGLVVVLQGAVAVRTSRLGAASGLLDIATAGCWRGRCGAIAWIPNSRSVPTHETTTLPHPRSDPLGTAETQGPAVFEVLARRYGERIEELEVTLAVVCERRPLLKATRTPLATATRAGRPSLGLTRAELGATTDPSCSSVARALDEPAGQRAITMGYRCVTVADRAHRRRGPAPPADAEHGGLVGIGSPR